MELKKNTKSYDTAYDLICKAQDVLNKFEDTGGVINLINKTRQKLKNLFFS